MFHAQLTSEIFMVAMYFETIKQVKYMERCLVNNNANESMFSKRKLY